MPTSIIAPDNHMAVLAGLAGVVALGFLSERTAIGKRFSGAVVVLATALILANFHILPASAPVYGFVWTMLVPLAIALYLIRADLTTLVTEGGRTALAFGFGAAGVVAGALIGVVVLDLGGHEADFAAVFTATYVGGSLNFAAVAEAIGFNDSSALAAAVAIDNVLGIGFILVLGFAATSRWFQGQFAWRAESLDLELDPTETQDQSISPIDLSAALFVAAAVCAVGSLVAGAVGLADYGLLFITVLIVLLATIGRGVLSRIRGTDTVALVFMYMFFAILAAGADIGSMVHAAPAVFWFVLIIFTTHLILLLVAARIFRLNYGECIVASLACIGGPTIAVAFAVLYGWRNLVTPAVATGVFGYVVGNFLGIGMFELVGRIQ